MAVRTIPLPGALSATPSTPLVPAGHDVAGEPGLAVDGLRKRFGSVEALAGVDLSAGPGEIVAVVGRNGAGKSTLIRILALSVVPDAGRIRLGGMDVSRQPGQGRGRAGLVLGEDRSFFWRLTGRQNLEFFAALLGMARRRARAAAALGLQSVGLAGVADRRVDRYSTGMRTRLGLARALLGTPSLLLLDEPTRSMDPAAAAEARALIRDAASRRRLPVLLATHDLYEAASLASSTVVLSAGRVVARFGSGVSPDELERAVAEVGR